MKIIIADDADLEREHLWILLERAGHTVIPSYDGINALNHFNKNPDVDLIITDYKMQGMDGLDLISNIRSIKADTRIWFVSAYLTTKIEQMALELGAEKAIWKTDLERELCKVGIIRDS